MVHEGRGCRACWGLFKIGRSFKEGFGVAQDDAQAVVWYEKAAEKGFVPAMFNLGLVYLSRRDGMPRDWDKKKSKGKGKKGGGGKDGGGSRCSP